MTLAETHADDSNSDDKLARELCFLYGDILHFLYEWGYNLT